MRLLRIEDGGRFSLVEFVVDIPRYAILSHTWGTDDQEVTYKDIVDNVDESKDKSGYGKICFCARQAVKDGLKYMWVDTCCIDKSSSAELSEAINSMYRWYRNAAKCYVYLSDVSVQDFAQSDLSFRKSRWFTRGWTLQELVAPTAVEFFSAEGERLGEKATLVQEIGEITHISVEALRGRPLPHFSVDERMSWAKRRETKREEDLAYSLLGIFDIHMPLIYGEGRNKALIRLQKEIDDVARGKWPVLPLVPTTEIVYATPNLREEQASSVDIQSYGQQRILGSLRFEQIHERKHQIHEAHRDTYQWILQPGPNPIYQWDNLVAWSSSSTESRKIYWIQGKPGSGKSTMMRFIEKNIKLSEHMLPWAEGRTVLRAQYFFWNPGDKLQKSLAGLLRALLVQLLEKQPHLVYQVVPRKQWDAALLPGNATIDWTNVDLRRTLHTCILTLRWSAKIFLLIDGLDELEGPDDACEELISLLTNLAKLDNVKICVSSRPWNIFRDAFETFPHLRLEELTRGDIALYAQEQLHSHIRFQSLLRYDRSSAERLTAEITFKAAGVFLWVHLVVREMLKGLRDGDGIQELWRKLNEIPSDLNDYFRRLMESISPQYRREASKLLQIALFREEKFTSVHPLRLLDLSFIDEGHPDFAITGRYNFDNLDLNNPEGLILRLDSALRRLNSRCMGLLECQYHPQRPVDEDGDEAYDLYVDDVGRDVPYLQIERGESFEPSVYPQLLRSPNLLPAFDLTVHFLHRSCREFLLTSEIRNLLYQYSSGEYDARLFLLNTRICQFVALGKLKPGGPLALAIASHLLSAISLQQYRNMPICLAAATAMKSTMESLAENGTFLESYWYIYPSVISWKYEHSSFLTLAIDFDLTVYVETHLTPAQITEKRGRPILDYILRPRFAWAEWLGIGNEAPNLEFLSAALRFGADPNELYESSSVWAHFLAFLADSLSETVESHLYPEFSGALYMLIRAGAAPLLPKSWLSIQTDYESYLRMHDKGVMEAEDNGHTEAEARFRYRWSDLEPAIKGHFAAGSEPQYAVIDLLERYRTHLGSDIDEYKKLLDSRGRVLIEDLLS